VVSFTTQPLYLQVKSPWYPLDRRLGGPQSHSSCSGEEKNSKLKSVSEIVEGCVSAFLIETSSGIGCGARELDSHMKGGGKKNSCFFIFSKLIYTCKRFRILTFDAVETESESSSLEIH
jgi:hypothetical protein